MPVWGHLYFQNSSSSVMEQLIFFHDHSMTVMIMIMVLVGYILFGAKSGGFNLGLFEGQELESIWTILPAVFLLMIAFPSIRLLYLMEEYEDVGMTVKVLGHQWYWSYEYGDLEDKVFESYMVKEGGVMRLVEVDNTLIFPHSINIRMVVSSMDVIHSWAIPNLGVKVDGVPGRLNYLSFNFSKGGIFIGQCSEICGANHSFMPISILVVPQSVFLGSI